MTIDQTTQRGRFIAAAVALAAERPWSEVTLRDIAERAGGNLVELRREFAGKGAILAAFTRAVDDAVLASAPARLPSQSARDALFDVVMARFDALAPYRAALRSIARAGVVDLAHARGLLASQGWMLAAAGIDTMGPVGAAKAAGLGSVYGAVVRTWLDDDDPGLARTMAVLDRRLRRGERTLDAVGSLRESCAKFGAVFCRRDGRAATGRASPTATGAEPPPAAPAAPA